MGQGPELVHVFPPGASIVMPGEVSEALHLVLEGQVGVEIGGKIALVVQGGEFFGVPVFGQAARQVAQTNARVHTFANLRDPALSGIFMRAPHLAVKLLEQVMRRIQQTERAFALDSRRRQEELDEAKAAAQRSGNPEAERLRAAIRGTIYLLQRELDKWGKKATEIVLEHLMATSGIREGKKVDVDDRFYNKHNDTISGINPPIMRGE